MKHSRLRRRLIVASDRIRGIIDRKPDSWEKMTFSEKLSWRCAHPDPMLNYTVWADKAKVKGRVAPWLDSPETYAFVDDPDEIAFLSLPSTFVMKATHGWNMSLLVEDEVVQGSNRSLAGAGRKSDADYLIQAATDWKHSQSEERRRNRERCYRHVDFGIIFEAYVCPVDYEIQLFLFSGRFNIALVFFRRFYFENVTAHIYDEDWRLLEVPAVIDSKVPPPPRNRVPRPPSDLFRSLERLCGQMDHVRADFLVSNGRYYLSEFTFTHNAGSAGLLRNFDTQLGTYWMR